MNIIYMGINKNPLAYDITHEGDLNKVGFN